MTQLAELKNNIYERSKMLVECEKSDEIKKTVLSIIKRDPVYFFKYFACTDRNPNIIPEEYGNVVPLMLFPFQEEFVEDAWDAILMGQLPIKERTQPTDIFSEKSRQMGFSWVFAGLQVYAFIFHNLKSLYISMKADEVDKKGDIKSHFEKMRFIIRNLPQWMLPEGLEKESGTEYNKFMNISRADGTGSIVGESANPNAGRGGTTAFTVFDEMAFMANASAINMSVASATSCRFFNSTPNGEGNEYFRMRKLAIEGKVRYHRCHWSEHPMYTPDWYKWKTQGMTKEQIAQELEIDYNVALQGRVYPNYRGETHEVEYDPTKPLFIAIDNSHGGSDPHAVIIMQPNYNSHYWDIIDSIEMNCDIPEMANFLAGAPKRALNDNELAFLNRYKEYNWRKATFVSDPYDTHTNIKNSHHPDGIVIYEEYSKVGIHLNIPNTKDNPKTAQIMKTRSNIDRLRVNERCVDFISSIQNACYPQAKEGTIQRRPQNEPIHDWTSHFRTALEYLTTYMLDNFVETQKNKNDNKKTTMEVRDPITGEVKIVYN